MTIWADPAEVQGKAKVDSMFYAGDEGVPWHGLGKEVPTAIDNTHDAILAAGQGWTVRTEDIQTVSGIPITGRRCRAIVREDRNTVLGVVGKTYRPLQNEEAFNFLDSLAADRKIRFHTAGVLGLGERMWILAQLPGDITIPKTDDTVKRFLLLSNSHDGTAAARVYWTPIRVVCQNTLNQAARGAKGEGVTIRHSGALEGKVREVQRILGLAMKAYDSLSDQIFASAKFKMSPAARAAYFNTLFGTGRKRTDEDGDAPAEGAAEEVHTRTQKTLDRLDELAETGLGNGRKGIRGSLWATYNAVTQYIDHDRATHARGDADPKSKRLESIWFGQGARIKEDAWTEVQKLIGAPAGALN